jgi:hypothetical protein
MSKHNRERRRKRREPNYLAPALAAAHEALAAGRMRPGQVYTVCIAHDDWCALLAGKGPCDCNPDVGPPVRLAAPEEN